MKVKLLEYYQDRYRVYVPESEHIVDDALGKWLVDNRKAVEVVVVEARYLNVEPQFEQAEEPPKPKSKRRK